MSQKPKRKEHSCEYLSKDIFEKDFINIFSHFLKVLTIFGLGRVEARDRFITAPTRLQKWYTILLAVAALFTLIITILIAYFIENRFDLYLIIVISSTHAVLYYVFVVLHSRFVNNEQNVKLYLMMQRVDRLLGIPRHPFLSLAIRRLNSIVLYMTSFLFLTTLVPACLDGAKTFFIFFGRAVFLFGCYLDITYVSNLIVYFFCRLRYINSILLNHIEGKPPKKRIGFELKLGLKMRQLTAESHDFRTCELDVYLDELIKCFNLYHMLHQLPIAMYIANVFISVLINTKSLIYRCQINELDAFVRYLIPLFTVAAIAQLFFLCVRFEMFYKEVKAVKRSVVAVMSAHFEGLLHEKAKRMWKLLEEVPQGFNVCGVWQVDAFFFISFFGVISTMVFSMLQFSFL